MNFKHVIGLDMAKETFVLAVHDFPFEQEYENKAKNIRKVLRTLPKVLNMPLSDCLFCLEHTGLYSLEIMNQLDEFNLSFVVVSGLEIKKSLGISRGKSDFIDARKIAEFAYLRQNKLKLYQLPGKDIIKLKNLLSLRAMHVRHKASYQARYNEQSRVLKKAHNPLLFQSQQRIIKQIEKEIGKVEVQINQLILSNDQFRYCFELVTSVKGIGDIIAAHMIVKTNCFMAFTDWRKFACYCGTAPFPHQSGKMTGSSKISKIGDKEMKTLLTLAARSAIIHDPEIKMFYQRKIEQGKTKKNVTNAVRNKLLARMFGVVTRGTPYVLLYKFAS